MNVIIKKLENKEHEYFAYAKSLSGKATYFVYFQDNIRGAVALHNFIEMLRSFFQPANVLVTVADGNIKLQNDALLEVLKT